MKWTIRLGHPRRWWILSVLVLSLSSSGWTR
jgi:hypothetical protein